MAWMIVRVRGSIHANRGIVETLRYLHLTRPNHATVVAEEPSFRGMLFKVQGYVTWGEADPAVVGSVLEARGRTSDGRPLSEATLREVTAVNDVPELSRVVTERGLPRVDGVAPLFRLKAPKGGWGSTKKPYTLGGALGYRGRAINELVQRMV
jgi:large subunit ribosomal protein L30